MKATALIADDEPRLREELTELPAQAWPALQVVALARNKTAAPAFPSGELPRQVVEELRRNGRSSGLRWLRAQVGPALRMIPVDRIDFSKADSGYTVIAWRTEEGTCSAAVVSLPLEELLAQLDPDPFVQVHRSASVNLGSVSHVVRHTNETADIHLKARPDVLRASRNFTHHFRQMQASPLPGRARPCNGCCPWPAAPSALPEVTSPTAPRIERPAGCTLLTSARAFRPSCHASILAVTCPFFDPSPRNPGAGISNDPRVDISPEIARQMEGPNAR